jgi:hypothetical protein
MGIMITEVIILKIKMTDVINGGGKMIEVIVTRD